MMPGPVWHYVTWMLPDQLGVKDGSFSAPSLFSKAVIEGGVSVTMAQPCIVWDSAPCHKGLWMSPEEFLSSRSFPCCTLPRLISTLLPYIPSLLISAAPLHTTLKPPAPNYLYLCLVWWSFSSLCCPGCSFNFRLCNRTFCWPVLL